MKKIVYTLIVLIVVSWYSFFYYLHLKRSSENYTDLLYLSAKDEVQNIQRASSSPNGSREFIKKNELDRIYINDVYYYKITVIECDNDWFVVAVPSETERYLEGVLSRVFLLDFSKVYYSMIFGYTDKSHRCLEDEIEILKYKEADKKCAIIDKLSFDDEAYYYYAE